MLTKRGIQASPGLVIGRAVVLDSRDQPVPRRNVSPSGVKRQHERLMAAIEQSAQEVDALREKTASAIGEELSKIFNSHLGMLRDPYLITQFEKAINEQHVTAEYAVYDVMRREARGFEQLKDPYFRERAKDIWDLERRILEKLIGDTRAQLANITHESILVAHDLTPSQTATLDRTRIKALVTNQGGRTSHTAILAHALGIPAIVGLEDATRVIKTGDTVIVDGGRGVVIIDPDAAKLLEYRQEIARMADVVSSLDELATLPARTKDGTDVTILGNIEFPSEIETTVAKGATGIGLYRTEFLFLAARREPSEQEQYETYLDAVMQSDGKPLTIRTLDLGADKFLPDDMIAHHEPNPFLGCRSIRLCLQSLPMFKTQLRAILRASAAGPVSIMFPLISNVLELRQAKMILQDVIEDLEDQRVEFRRDIPVGIMIEVPSAALQANILAKEVDFFSIGTNDLIQYTVAADRSNERIANLYTGAHPAVLALIRDVVRAAQRAGIGCSICGEMGGEVEFTMPLIGFGLRSFSITPPAIPEIKQLIRSVSVDMCKRVARKVCSLETDREVLNYLRGEVARVLPDLLESRSIGA